MSARMFPHQMVQPLFWAGQSKRTRTGVPPVFLFFLASHISARFSAARSAIRLVRNFILMRPGVTLTKLDAYRLRQKNEDRTHFGPELEQDVARNAPKWKPANN